MHGIDFSVVVSHPLEKNRFRHTVNVALGHIRLYVCLTLSYAWQILETLSRDSIQVVDLQDLVENGQPRV
jgi:hypothetical protein